MKPLVTLGLLAASGLAGLADAALAQPGGPYVGVTGIAARPRVSYEKTVDNTAAANVSPSRGQVYRTDGAAYAAGFLAGYRLPLGAGGAYLSPEVDVALGGGAVRGRLAGAGFSEGRNQLGGAWPEAWSLEATRGYGLTLRLGAGVGSDAGVYGLAGLRRLEAMLTADFTGCFDFTLCSPCLEHRRQVRARDRLERGRSTGVPASASPSPAGRPGCASGAEIRSTGTARSARGA